MGPVSGAPRALEGVLVWNTRPRAAEEEADGAGGEAFSQALAAAGARELRLPTARVRPASHVPELDAAFLEAGRILAWIFTSARAARLAGARAQALGARLAVEGGALPAVWAVGPQTAAALAAGPFAALPRRELGGAGGRELWPALRRALPPPAPGRDTLVWPRSSLAALEGWQALLALGYRGLAPVVYQTEAVPEDPEAVRRAAQDPRGGVVWLASPSAARGLALAAAPAGGSARGAEAVAALGAWRVACIGRTTAAAARAAGLPVHAVAASPAPADAVAALAAALAAEPGAGGPGMRHRTEKG
ncbi:MAG: uroporphyrinogen-III synthase [Firmicutes bacterium]|nr:uroporphyrinogen-III synthase [Bacillota bacterium]